MKQFRPVPYDAHCPYCQETTRQTLGRVDQTGTDQTIGKQADGLSVVRRRSCLKCESSWLTYEVNEQGFKLLFDAYKALQGG